MSLQVAEAVPTELLPIPATVVLIRELRAAGHELHYLSNMPAPYADHWGGGPTRCRSGSRPASSRAA